KAVKDTLIRIGDVPEAKFVVNDIAFGDNTEFDQNSLLDQYSFIDSVAWDFDDGTVVSGTLAQYDKVSHTFLDSGNYHVSLRVVTDRGCVGQTVQPVSILPQISEFPYFQNFEGTSGWVQGGVRSSWEVGTPSGPVINSAYSGSNAWVTNLDG